MNSRISILAIALTTLTICGSAHAQTSTQPANVIDDPVAFTAEMKALIQQAATPEVARQAVNLCRLKVRNATAEKANQVVAQFRASQGQLASAVRQLQESAKQVGTQNNGKQLQDQAAQMRQLQKQVQEQRELIKTINDQGQRLTEDACKPNEVPH